jgi:hypothetical protein
LPDHFVQILKAGEGVARIVDEGRCLRVQAMQTPLMLMGCEFDAEVEADVVPLRSRDLVIEFFELLPDDLHLLPPKVFMPVDGRLGSARAFSAEIT